MKQDWSRPFTVELCDSVRDFCVYCETEADAYALFDYLDSAFIPRNLEIQICQGYPCYRFEHGKLVKHDSVRTYESSDYYNWVALPKFTFYPGYTRLPELNIPDSSAPII